MLGLLVLNAMMASSSATQSVLSTNVAAGLPLLLEALVAASTPGSTAAEPALAIGRVNAQMPDIAVEGVASQALLAQAGGISPAGGSFFDVE